MRSWGRSRVVGKAGCAARLAAVTEFELLDDVATEVFAAVLMLHAEAASSALPLADTAALFAALLFADAVLPAGEHFCLPRQQHC